MRGSRKFCQRGSNFGNLSILVDEGRDDPHTTLVDHHRPASETPFKWRFAVVPMMAKH